MMRRMGSAKLRGLGCCSKALLSTVSKPGESGCLNKHFNEYLCKPGLVIAGLTRNLLRFEKIAGQARNDEDAYLFIYSA